MRRPWQDFSYAWGALAGKEAVLFAMTSEERDFDAALTGWAAARPNEALAMLGDLPEQLRNDRDRLAATIVTGIAQSDPGLGVRHT